jgi:hypothetical protein
MRVFSRIDRRQVILGMVSAVGAVALRSEAPAAPAPDTRAYVAFFLGLGDYVFSWGIPLLEAEARKLGFATDVFRFNEVDAARTSIVRKRKEGYKIALVGYSLGNAAATYLQSQLAVDLLIAISESSLAGNHPIKKENTRRSVLWYGPDLLSNAGVDDGFDETNYIESLHLLMPLNSRLVRGVVNELKSLVSPEKRDKQFVVTNAPAPKRIASPIADRIGTGPAPAQRRSTGWLPATNVIMPDVTCMECWGFTQSLGPARPDAWLP